MLFVGTSIIHPSTEGVFLLCNILDLLIYSWYDKEHDGELIETLQAYLDCDKSANKAAEKLYVNYRTLSGRLKKIKDISGIDFKNSAEMLAVRNGIVLFKMAETL